MPSDESSYIERCVSNLSGFPHRWLNDRGITDSSIQKYLLGWDEQRKAVVIPYLNALGEVRKIRYRNFEGEPKYIWEGGGEKGAHLFHVKATRKPEVWLTEGEFDAICLAQMGFPSVAVPGAGLFKPEWRYLFAYTNKLTVVFDPDEPGLAGAQRIASILGPMVNQIKLVKLPKDNDVSDLYKKDQAALRELIQ